MATLPKYKPGPGWSKNKKTGAWLPHYFLTQDFGGAGLVSLVFKVLAVLILIGGVVSAIVTTNTLHQNGVNHQDTFAIVIGIVAGAVVSASAMAFFGYVLDLLRAIHYGTGYDNAAKEAFNETSAAVPTKPSGWYPSPGDEGTLRWWDGQRWNDQTLKRQM